MMLQSKSRGVLRYVIFIYALLVIGIGVTSWAYYYNQKEEIKRDKQEALSSVATLKVNEISRWRKERLDDSSVIMQNTFAIIGVQQWFADPENAVLKQVVSDWMKALMGSHNYDYKDIFLLDERGSVRLSVFNNFEEVEDQTQKLADQALRTKEIVLSDLYRAKNGKDINLDILIPLFIRKGRATLPVGVIVSRIDPYRFFYPLVQSWPTPAKTAETLIVRREGSDVLFLNELRHRKDTALLFRLPVNERNMPAAMAVQGTMGIVEGLDYRGVKVLAVIKKIPDTPWILIAKIDDKEVYAAIRNLFWIVTIVGGGLITTAGIALGFVWHRQSAQFYRRQYETELKHTELSQRYEYLTRHANDIILTLDRDGGIVEANERAIATYQYPRDELLRMNASALSALEYRADIDAVLAPAEGEVGRLFETLHRRRDGTAFPVEVSSRMMLINGEEIHQNIIRDITERKAAEKRQVQLIGELANVNCELKDFAQIVSHDLKAPLRAIGSLARWLETDYSDKFDERGREQVNLLISRVKRLDAMIGCILKYSQAGRVNEDLVEVNLNDLVTNVTDMLAPPGNIKVLIEGELPTIVCQRTRIEQVFQNLLGNALKFMDKPAGEIRIGCAAEGDCWKFKVSDNGPGIEDKYFERIFQIFQTLKSRDESENTGVGLALVKKIVEMYGGKVWVESTVGRGSTFYWTLKRDMNNYLEKGVAA